MATQAHSPNVLLSDVVIPDLVRTAGRALLREIVGSKDPLYSRVQQVWPQLSRDTHPSTAS